MARAIRITPQTRSIERIKIDDREDIATIIGFGTLESDAVGDGGDRLFFDEECFIRGASGRFKIDSNVPAAGIGVVVGTGPDGHTLRDVQLSLDEIAARTEFT